MEWRCFLGSGKDGLNKFDRGNCYCALAWGPRGATALRLIGEVDSVALIEEVGSPTLAVIGGIEEVLERLTVISRILGENPTVPV